MKKTLLAAVAIAAILTCTAAQAQDTPVADASAAFAQIAPDHNGTVTQPIMHAPAGDVIAVYIGRTPLQVYEKQDELLIVISGHGTAHVGYPSYDLKPGSVLSVPRGTAFQVIATGTAPVKGYLIASPADDPSARKVLEP